MKSYLQSVSSILLMISTASFFGTKALALDPWPVSYVEGTLYDSSDRPLSGNITISAQITNDAGANEDATCILYQESDIYLDLTGRQGQFSIKVGESAAPGSPSLSHNQIFANTGETTASLTSVSGQPCSFTAGDQAKRILRLNISGATGNDVLLMPLGSTPFATVAQNLQGYEPHDLIRVDNLNNLTQSNVGTIFSNFTELEALINGTSTQYAIRSANGASQLPGFTTATPPVSPSAGDIWFDSSTNQIKYSTGSGVETVGTSSTSLPNVGTSGTYTKVTTDAKGRVTAGATLSESDIPALTSAGNGVDGGAITTGTIGGSTAIDISGNIETSGAVSVSGNVGAASFSGRSFVLWDSDDTNSISISAPITGSLTTNYSLTLPSNDGNSGNVLETDGNGVLTWAVPQVSVNRVSSGSGLYFSYAPNGVPCDNNEVLKWNNTNQRWTCGSVGSLGGVVTSVFTRSGAVTAQSGDYTAAQVTNAAQGGIIATTVQAAINELDTEKQNTSAELTGVSGLSTNGLIVRNGAGDYSTTPVTIAGKALLDDVSTSAQRITLGLGTLATQSANDVAITGGAINGTTIGATTRATASFTTMDTTGNAIVGGTLSVAGDTDFSGDVKVAANKTVGIGRFTNAEDSSLTARLTAGDEGKFWYNADTDSLRYWNGSAAITLGVSGAGLQSLSGDTTNAQTLSIANGAGVLAPTWNHNGTGDHELRLPSASDAGVTHGLISRTDYDNFSNKISNQGNSFGSTAVIGTNDLNPLVFETNNTETMLIDVSGNVGIGTLSPDAKVHISRTENGVADPILRVDGFNSSKTNYLQLRNMHATPLATGISFWNQNPGLSGEKAIIMYNHDEDDMRFYVGNDPTNAYVGSEDLKMVIKSDGRVGIGTADPSTDSSSNPDTLLHVMGNIQANGTGATCVLGDSGAGASCSSDRRLKKDIVPISDPLMKIRELQGVNYNWNQKASNPGKPAMGVIAQDVEKQFPTAVVTGEDGYKRVDYAVLVAPLIEAVKELWMHIQSDSEELAQTREELAQLKAESNRKISSLKAENELLNNRLNSLSDRLDSLESSP